MEFTQCVEEAVTEIQLYYDSILLKQNEIIEELTRRVDRLEKTVAIKQSPFEADIIATKDSLQKLKKAIMSADPLQYADSRRCTSQTYRSSS